MMEHHRAVGGGRGSGSVRGLGLVAAVTALAVLGLAACSTGSGGSGSPTPTESGGRVPIPQPGQEFRFVGRTVPTPGNVLPLASGRSTYASLTAEGLLVGAAGSSGCYPVPFEVRSTSPQQVRVDFVDPARVTSEVRAERLPKDVVCTRDYTIKSYFLGGLAIDREAPLTVELVIHRDAALGGDVTEVSTI